MRLSSPERTVRPTRLVLDVIDACQALVEHGVPAATVEEVDFTLVVRTQENVGEDLVVSAVRRDEALTRLRAGSGHDRVGVLEHTGVESLRGSLVVLRGVKGVGWDKFARVRLADGEVGYGLVLEVDRDIAVVQPYLRVGVPVPLPELDVHRPRRYGPVHDASPSRRSP